MSRARPPVRIAMWSGPRNISTALMRSWGNRPDATVTDEPLYGHYLRKTGLEHPGRDEVMAEQSTDWREVVDWLTGPVPDGKAIWYQKHMAHHLLDEIDREWLKQVTNCFLIRHPREVLASYLGARDAVGVDDMGFRQQAELFQFIWDGTSPPPPIVNAKDLLENPAPMLRQLCACIGVDFHDDMLVWAPGPRPTDGSWGKVWYSSVNASTGFIPYQPKQITLSPELDAICEACEPHYRLLHRHRLQVDSDDI